MPMTCQVYDFKALPDFRKQDNNKFPTFSVLKFRKVIDFFDSDE